MFYLRADEVGDGRGAEDSPSGENTQMDIGGFKHA